jgi:anti-sigma regulatory factor (Ser/Thr protein kinase)
MRDPGRPRRNPFFEHDAFGDSDGAGMGFRDPEAEPAEDPTAAAGGLGALLALVSGLADAQPEAAEHLVAAAHEVVLTVKVLVDATEAVLADQRAGMAARREAAERDAGDGTTADEAVDPPVDASISPLRRSGTP